jgi:23S rRNA (uracil1939-C5)-methyltransferase
MAGSVNPDRAARGSRAPAGSGAPVRLRIEGIGAGGEGVGRLDDGRVVFVHRTAPGELVEAALVEQRKRWARGRLLRVLEASAHRREPPCPFAAECGGCALEHLEYDAQLRAKRQIVEDALRRLGGVELDVPDTVASPRETRYRNRVSFALRRLDAGRVVAGFHALGDPGRIVDVDGRCLLPEPAISAVWDRLRAGWGRDARLLPSGERLRLTLRGTADGEVALLVEGGFTTGRPQELLDAVDGLAAVWHRPEGGSTTLLAGTPTVRERWGGETFELGGAAFLQVNREAAALLDSAVHKAVGAADGRTVVDAYCGVGIHARRLARAGARVTGIELDADAVAAANRDAPDGARFVAGTVEGEIAGHLPADVVILNPPRGGVAEQVADALRESPPQRIVYVSCDPATLARDVRRLGPGFRVASAQPFDLFPQTAHVETVAVIEQAE